MTWTPSGSISPKTNWQYTEPVEGSYFKLKHSGFPVNNSYLLANAQVNAGSVELANIQEFTASDEAEVIYLKAPPVFDSGRRIAIKRVSKQPGLEAELRRVFRNAVLEDSDIQSLSRRSTWSVSIEASDYVEPVTSGGGTPPPPNSTIFEVFPCQTEVQEGAVNSFVASSIDLANANQPSFSAIRLLSGSALFGSSVAKLVNGSTYGANANPIDTVESFTPSSGAVVVIDFTTGVDIKLIKTISSNETRHNQKYRIDVAEIDSNVFTNLISVDKATGMVEQKVEIYPTTSSKLATKVGKMRFTFLNGSNGIETVYREIDVFGT